MGDGDAEDLVGDTAGHQDAVYAGRAGCNLLGKCSTHKQIAEVGHQAHGNYLNVGCLNGNERIDPILASRGSGEETADEPDGCCQPGLPGNDAQREGDGKIAHTDGNADAKSCRDVAALHNSVAKLHVSIETTKQMTGKNLAQ